MTAIPYQPANGSGEKVDVLANRVIRDGKVAVLYSPGYGAGWSTWADDDQCETMLFHPRFVKWVEDGKPEPIDDVLREVFPGVEHMPCASGAADLKIDWIECGEAFEITEYDGSESIEYRGRISWWIA
jgi:hypothetical protein